MSDTSHAMLRALFHPDAAPSPQVEALLTLVIDLAVEVEALRATVADDPQLRATYRARYAEAAMLPHDASGPSGGLHKLLARYYGDETVDEWSGPTSWRELLMLRRLGASPDDLAAWQAHAREAQTFT